MNSPTENIDLPYSFISMFGCAVLSGYFLSCATGFTLHPLTDFLWLVATLHLPGSTGVGTPPPARLLVANLDRNLPAYSPRLIPCWDHLTPHCLHFGTLNEDGHNLMLDVFFSYSHNDEQYLARRGEGRMDWLTDCFQPGQTHQDNHKQISCFKNKSNRGGWCKWSFNSISMIFPHN